MVWQLCMNAIGPVPVHDGGTIAGVGDGVGGGVGVMTGVGRTVGEAAGDAMNLGVGVEAVAQATTISVVPINVESLDGEGLIWCVLLPIWLAERRASRAIAASL